MMKGAKYGPSWVSPRDSACLQIHSSSPVDAAVSCWALDARKSKSRQCRALVLSFRTSLQMLALHPSA